MSEPGGRGAAGTEKSPREPKGPVGAPEVSGTGAEMTSVETHLGEILDTIRPLAPTELGLSDALGLVLAEDVAADVPLPSFDNSSMDGYAVRVQDVATASEQHPVSLPVVA